MRVLLDRLYRVCGVLAAAFLALIAALVVAQVVGRLGGVLVPGADELASFSLTASSFLALAPTLRAGAHIRVTLLVRPASPAGRRRLELWCLGFGAAVAGYFAYHVFEMARDAFQFGEKSQGILPIPLWLPQSAMMLGIVVLAIAFVDEFVRVLRRGRPSYPDDLETLEERAPTAATHR
jgi:TRAP-type C4-dicarboxylate transport system permease small subunit